jgi:hypothetical protein
MILRLKDDSGNWHEVPAIKGPKGDSYNLTKKDKEEIADIVIDSIPNLPNNGGGTGGGGGVLLQE